MAELEGVPTFGAELKDGFKPANVWVAHGITWLDDIQQFYRERSAVEKEYSARLNALAKKYYEKKSKKAAALSVGDSPVMTPGSLESASLTTWATQLTTLEQRAAEHDRYASELVTQLVEPLKSLGLRFDELRKRHAEYAEKLEKERDSSYSDLRKVKHKYDAACQEVEARRKKSESAFDKARAQSHYQQQMLEMNNVKNSYLIAINVTNKQKDMYYAEYVPELMDSLQDLSEFRTIKLNGLWSLAAQLEGDLMQQSHGMMQRLGQEIGRNEPHLDSLMYMRHNIGSFEVPAEKKFEPSPVWHDDDTMAVDEAAKVYLRNVLSRSKGQLGELRREVDKKKREVEGIKRQKQKVRDGAEEGDEVELVRQMFALQEDLHQVDHKRITAEIEATTITSVVGDVTLGAKNHNFKAQTFKIPTNCDLCGERIWGLSARGFDCRDCGYECHGKCEMKVPAECPGEQSKDARKKLKAERQIAANALLKAPVGLPDHVADMPTGALSRSSTVNTANSLGSRRTSRLGSSGRDSSPPEERPAEPSPPAPSPSISMSTSTSTSTSTKPVPVSVSIAAVGALATGTAKKPRIMAPPPTPYIGELPGSVPNGSAGASAQRGEMLYTFEANGAGEISVSEGREVTILEPDDGSGWVKIRAGYKEGIVPSSYIEPTAAAPVAQQDTGIAARPKSVYSNSGSSIGAAAKRKGPAVAPKRGARKLRYVEALYEYAAQNDTEHSMAAGERLILIKEDPGDGWVEVEKGGSTRSVPASYVQEVA